MNIELNLSRIDTKVAQLTHLKTQYELAFGRLQEILPSLEANLAKAGLKISRLGHSKTGTDCDVWQDSDKLRVEISAAPISETSFRFISFSGYKASGAGKNEDALRTKAAKLAEKIGHGAQVNQFSLELKHGETKSVLISLWIKPN